MRTITALFANRGRGTPDNGLSEDQPLEARVASISAEIAAAIAHAQSRVYDDEDEEDEDEDESEQEMDGPDIIGPHTSGIRGRDGMKILDLENDEDDDSDAFPIPLRTRKGKEALSFVGTKRKR